MAFSGYRKDDGSGCPADDTQPREEGEQPPGMYLTHQSHLPPVPHQYYLASFPLDRESHVLRSVGPRLEWPKDGLAQNREQLKEPSHWFARLFYLESG